MERCGAFSAFSGASVGKAALAVATSGIRSSVIEVRLKHFLFWSLQNNRSRRGLSSRKAFGSEKLSIPATLHPDIPFLGINRVISMKKRVDPQFRSR
jgi:hypothetical protein